MLLSPPKHRRHIRSSREHHHNKQQRSRHRDTLHEARPVKADNQIADFASRALNAWLNGTHGRSTILSFDGPSHEMAHLTQTMLESTSQQCSLVSWVALEYLLHASASYLGADVANIAAARGVELTSFSSAVEGYVDRRAIPGLPMAPGASGTRA